MSPVPGPGETEAGETSVAEMGPADVVLVPPDDDSAGRLALTADESLTPESLEALTEQVPLPLEEMVHEESALQEFLLDEGDPYEPLSDDEFEAALASDDDTDRGVVT